MREEYAAYKKDCADVERVQPTIERAEKYLDLCDAIISSATKQDAFSKRDMGQFLADHGPMQTLREYLYFEARFPMGCDMRDYASALKDSLRDVDKLEVQEKVDAYNERQTDSAYKLHIGDDGGIYTSFGYRISYDYEPNQFLDQMSNDLDSYVQAIEHAENIGTDVPDTALSDIVGSSFSVDSLKSAIDLMEAEVKSTADDDRDAQETMDTDPVLSEDIPESSIEPEVDDSLDADEWRRYL